MVVVVFLLFVVVVLCVFVVFSVFVILGGVDVLLLELIFISSALILSSDARLITSPVRNTSEAGADPISLITLVVALSDSLV